MPTFTKKISEKYGQEYVQALKEAKEGRTSLAEIARRFGLTRQGVHRHFHLIWPRKKLDARHSLRLYYKNRRKSKKPRPIAAFSKYPVLKKWFKEAKRVPGKSHAFYVDDGLVIVRMLQHAPKPYYSIRLQPADHNPLPLHDLRYVVLIHPPKIYLIEAPVSWRERKYVVVKDPKDLTSLAKRQAPLGEQL